MQTAYLTPPAAAKLLGIDPSKVLAWIRSGELRAYNVAQHRHGRPRWRIAPADLEAFLASRRNEAPPPPRTRLRVPSHVIRFIK